MKKNAAMGDPALCNESHPFVIVGNGNFCTFFFAGMVEVIKNFAAMNWFEEMCDSRGSTVQGRKDSFKKTAEHKRKPAILISEVAHEMYFPLKSAMHTEYIWIQYNALVNYHEHGHRKTKLVFKDGSVFIAHCDYRAVANKLSDCSAFVHHLSEAEDGDPVFG